jgi:NDP-sugar pyrophosphorylase family protein
MALSARAVLCLEGTGIWFDVGSIETLEEANRVFSKL